VGLEDRVAELIQEALLSGRLQPGERIVEMKVANEVGVATTAVREALFELEAQS
jgi:DNA-binding GntR family transcriptional regulator